MNWVKILGGVVVLLVAAAAGALLYLPGYAERGQGGVEPHDPYVISSEAAALHASLFVADLHADALLWKRSLLSRAKRGHVDAPRLQEGNVALQVFSAVTKVPAGINYEENTAETDQLVLLSIVQAQPPATWRDPFERALFQADKLHRAAERSDSLRIIRTASDLAQLETEAQRGQPVVGGLLALEGMHMLDGDIARVQQLYDAGFRMGGLQHFFDNELGGSLHGTSGAGLTPFGRRVLAEMERRRMIVDVAHSSQAVVEDVLAAATRPFIVSHTGFYGHCPGPRNLPDDIMLRIAETGGIIGVGFWADAICDASPQGIAKAIVYGVNLVGEDHVAIGTDFDGAVTTRMDASEMAAVTQALMDEGLTSDQIRKVMGANVARFLADALPPGR